MIDFEKQLISENQKLKKQLACAVEAIRFVKSYRDVNPDELDLYASKEYRRAFDRLDNFLKELEGEHD